jgi:DNA (cytosine-5)-methyltransferase 1
VNERPLKHLDLFSGIGGFALAADSVFRNVEHTFCEIDPFCQAVLKKHWPDAPVHGDIKELKITEQFDIVTGGFPCQPFSGAGLKRGAEDERNLWPEMLRVISEARPSWIVGENVARLAALEEFEGICSDLEGLGYEVGTLVIPACAVNAPHRRDRIWIVAHAEGLGHGGSAHQERRVQEWELVASEPEGCKIRHQAKGCFEGYWPDVAAELCRMDDGIPNRLDRIKACGNAIVPQVAEEIMSAIRATEGR